VLASTVVWSALAATPALATVHRDDGDDPGPSISTLKAILVFVVTPIGATVLIALLVMLPSLAKGPRYRLGEEWRANPEWYGAPGAELESGGGYGPHGHAAVAAPPAAEQEAITGTIVPSDAETESGQGGGSSARW
jgi:hypothetical protein